MADGDAQSEKAVVVFFEDKFHLLSCDYHMTMAQVKRQWQNTISRLISVAFFLGERYLSDDTTVGEALPNSTARCLELHAFPKSKLWLQVIGFEETNTPFEVAVRLTPAAVRREMGRAIEVYTDDFRLIWNGAELDQESSFEKQGLMNEAQLMVDLRAIVKVHFGENNETKTVACFGSDSVGCLRQQLGCGDDMALVINSPYHVLGDTLRVCQTVSELMDLQIPIQLSVERKVMLTFEPISLERLREKLPIALSWTPLDVHDLVRERFGLDTEFRLSVKGQELDNCEPLFSQLSDIDDVIQVDVLRRCLVSNLWECPLDTDCLEEVFLYSTESCNALYLWDELSNQRVYHNDINLTVFGSIVDIFGAVSSQEKPFILVDRDIERKIPILTFDGVVRKHGWARDMLLDIVPKTRGLLPEEIMRSGHLLAKSTLNDLRLTEDTLMVTDPEKIFISSDKKLRMCRFAHGATYSDVRTRMQKQKGCLDIGLRTREWHIPDEAMNRKIDRELLFLTSESSFKTKLMVTIKGQWFGCWFQSQQVCFSDVMVSVGKQAKVMPRHLFSKDLFCCGCGRQLSLQEEPHQAIPAACCKVKSLRLTDRKVKDVGVQSAVSKKRDVETFTLDIKMQDACVSTESECGRAIVSVTSELESVATFHAPSASVCIYAENPEGESEFQIVSIEGSNCADLFAAADCQLNDVRLGHSPVISSIEMTYVQNQEERTAILCFDKNEEGDRFPCVDLHNGEVVDESISLHEFRRFLRPSSPLTLPPNLPPFILIRTEVDLLTVSPRRQLLPAPPDALMDPSFVVFLPGIKSGEHFFWELLSQWCYVSAEELCRVFKIDEIPGGPKRCVFLLLRFGDPLPRFKVPEDEEIFLHHRAGIELRIQRGCVRCIGSSTPIDLDLWDCNAKREVFLKSFEGSGPKKFIKKCSPS